MHFCHVERARNRGEPTGDKAATFQYPLWSLIGDFPMAALMAMGRMQREVDKVVGARRAKPD